MVKRCPHCQTRPLRADAEDCWYCGRSYRMASPPQRPVRLAAARRASRPLPARGFDLAEPR